MRRAAILIDNLPAGVVSSVIVSLLRLLSFVPKGKP